MDKPKTDLERFVELYKSFGVECIITPKDDQFVIQLAAEQDEYMFRGEGVTTHKSFDGGYSFFYTIIRFDAQGKYIYQRFLE